MWQLASDCRHPASALLMRPLTTTQVKVNLNFAVEIAAHLQIFKAEHSTD
jgi:hypothetical protein